MWIYFLTPRVLTNCSTNSKEKKKNILINYDDQLHLSLFGFWILCFAQYAKQFLEGEEIFVGHNRVIVFT